ncbi:MAG: hypothetical protein Q4D04_05565 [Clostridia bacterium]|nr:hypothetical protein [Clostridia bacterium]
MRIDTTVKRVAVEIEGNLYEVEPKTVATAERLKQAEHSAEGEKARYQLWLDQLGILLGKAAVKRLFPAGKNENLDRMELIYLGVMDAFDAGARQAREARNQQAVKAIEDMEKQLRPLRELLESVSAQYEMIGRE